MPTGRRSGRSKRCTVSPAGGAPRSSTPRAWDGFHRTAPSANTPDKVWDLKIDLPAAVMMKFMEALFIGQTYIDVTFLADQIPTGRREICRLGLCGVVRRQCGHGGILLRETRHQARPDHHHRRRLARATCSSTWRRNTTSICTPARSRTPRSPSSCRTTASAPSCAAATITICTPFPVLDLDGCRALHLDGHQPDAALLYAQRCRKAGILTSLDGGGLRTTPMSCWPSSMSRWLRSGSASRWTRRRRRCSTISRAAAARSAASRKASAACSGTTRTARSARFRRCAVPAARVRDTSGAGDVFHGAYVYSYLTDPFKGWEEHFRFAQHAAAYKIQHLGNEAGLPTLDAIEEVAREFDQDCRAASPGRRAKTSPRCAQPLIGRQVLQRRPAIAAASSDARSRCPAR